VNVANSNKKHLIIFVFVAKHICLHICSFQRNPEAARATNTQQTWQQEFLGSRSSTVERSSTRIAAAGTFLQVFQTIFENTSLWRLKRLVTLSTYRRYINKCICLSINLSISTRFHLANMQTVNRR